ncbi:MAG TPA: hypothetical protein VFV38_06645 [Ktedonobacteraceae bacterium]|nr:hypothetical protein [Ktedonobacteraceae bacterium]
MSQSSQKEFVFKNRSPLLASFRFKLSLSYLTRRTFGSPPTDAAQHKQARIRLMHLMSHLRSQVWVFGLDIVAVMNVGYLLLSSSEPEPASSFADTDQVAR